MPESGNPCSKYFFLNCADCLHMKNSLFKFLLFLFLSLLLFVPMQFRLGPLPDLGAFFNPFSGFWQQAEGRSPGAAGNMKLNGLQEQASIVYDDRLVPHIFAGNDHDLYFLQGYVTASHRLFQMDLQTRVAAGRIAEVVGEKALNLDRSNRRLGLTFAAEKSIEAMMKDPLAKLVMESYSEGVNAFISSLNRKTLPLEYKLMGFEPEPWSPLRSALLLKYMANMLTGYETDFENTNAVKLLGYNVFNEVFPLFPDTLLDPVIPIGTTYPVADTLPESELSFKPSEGRAETALAYPFERPEPDYGSNNWAVHGSRTASGNPVLCNDPHLGLNLPSIWFEIQLNSPQANVYGASLPGAPCVISGFNDSIAWGITNASMDVKDWYSIEFRDASRKEYLFDGEWKKSEIRIEEIKVRGAESILDTVIYTLHGPVAFDKAFNNGSETVNRALQWTAHEGTSELLTFYNLNNGSNYDDYRKAISWFKCPGQNFVFASAAGDIAITQQGKFVHRYPDQGRFIMDGTTSATLWQGFIPDSANPSVKNPERGWVSSANQHPTDESYPYWYTGHYEYFRNRRINERLAQLSKAKTDDMMALQNDNYNLYAAEILPLMLAQLVENDIRSNERQLLNSLREWSYFNEAEQKAPGYFQIWWDLFYNSIWDEFENKDRSLIKPSWFQTIRYLKTHPEGDLLDKRNTPETESMRQLALESFHKMADSVDQWKVNNKGSEFDWAAYRNTSLTHITRLSAFSIDNIINGGGKSIVNATSENWGPSWRMVVSPGQPGQAFGVYPGGQSGNPGSPYYDNFVDSWSKGKYYNLLILKPDEQHQRILSVTRCTP